MDTPIVAVVGRRSEDGITLALTGVGAQPVVARSIDDINQLIPSTTSVGRANIDITSPSRWASAPLGDLS